MRVQYIFPTPPIDLVDTRLTALPCDFEAFLYGSSPHDLNLKPPLYYYWLIGKTFRISSLHYRL